ncbi:hypothetical protein [uncultured Desulfovibrio sp.]|uniref:hypothetical protein n=1 Tax=uncultured Desulfovibrio sp. TaxID=167968 RepID=UPI00272A431A|nr:hypothetical protein [uncultured Desulfovibrio sp.]
MPTLRMTTAIFSAEYWERKNPILLRGERGLAEFYDEDGHVMRIREKVGDGVMGEDGIITGTRWNDLPWFFNGLQGEKGDTGPMPRHDWKGTALRFENADGTWGDRVDLKGEPGNRVNAEPATTTTLGGVMPATGLRVDIEGYEYVALGWDRHACYPDPIVVLHDDSAWLWLQKSGVGTDAGVRVPGTDAAAQYWRKVANFADIPGPGIGLSHDKQLNVYDVKYGNASGTALEGNGTALAAKKLETPRAITVNVGSPYGAAFDGTKDIQPGVTGVLPISNGGTGANNLSSLAQALAGTGQLGGGGATLSDFGTYSIRGSGTSRLIAGPVLSPVAGTLKRVVFSTSTYAGSARVVGVTVNGAQVATSPGEPTGRFDLSVPVGIGSTISLNINASYFGGGDDSSKEGKWRFSVLIQ